MSENTLKICIGTPCHLMGAADLLESVEELDQSLREKIELKTSHCIDNCCDQAPVAEFNGKVYQDLNPEKLYKIISENIR
ncbi:MULTISPECIES: NAD(P)H-dependent oxidoreductase subunit E [Halanaerobium]|jgi:NADH:ubiquinone oxidoreductase subunit E|uniref:Thioredoxin-like [2Fe-2S] ferredoxin n=1 Tax=Halanaerobium congolense TaxID=54121 RepID=A0A1G6TBF5_9FIRM|nr:MULTISPECIES: NAD(P)H-dependent oxidoreductase subunit E [Halanaerobium]PUU86726.1 MAG: NADH-quinone oxidoreductase chain E [Halanaerobium sp.]PUU90013.1 MAG: NADH-quinone oxidoreductase chain E [Halanaerobium sp.]TDS35474.1 thioredoxin-like protein [Halanaerobium congolense]SDD25876.1 Thioredoxin-like [2Fe-2S] ferredoxin [Halanaerobium congolense]